MGASALVLGTTNPAKLQKLRWLLDGLPVAALAPDQLPEGQRPPDDEVGASHLEIARHKALAWSHATSLPAIATDGGLSIPALGEDWTSLLTRRFAGEPATVQDRTRALLEMMEPVKGAARQANWIEALAIASGGLCLASWEVPGPEGTIMEEAPAVSVSGDFWVFPLLYIPILRKTYDQLTPQELAQVNDHWTQLRALVHHFFRGHPRLLE